MRHTADHQSHPRAARPAGLPFADQPGPDSAFWSGAIGAGAGVMAELAEHLDVLSQGIVQLPEQHAAARPAALHYLARVRALAQDWRARTRPALAEALEALTHAGASLAQPFTLEALAGHAADEGRAAVRVLESLQRRLAAPAASLGRLAADFDAALAGMARATADLQSDTLLVSERLQSDHVHAFLLSQQASALQSKLDDANLRQDAYWLQGPHSEHIRQEIALHSSALEGVRRQLDHLHAEQAATRAQAHHLQTLMPSLSGYLGALDRLAGGMRATLAGIGAMAGELDELTRALSDDPGAAAGAAARLRAALPRWRALGAVAARLRPGYVKTRAGHRT